MKYKNKMRKYEKFNCIQMCLGFKIKMISTSYVYLSFLKNILFIY